MAPKRASPLEDPPAPSSSSEEEADSEDINGRENPEEEEEEVDDDESEEESEEEEEEEEPPKQASVDKPTSMKKPTPTTVTTPQPQSSSSDEGSDSDSDSSNTQPSPSASDFTVKPIVSKPMDDPTKPKKPAPKPTAPVPSTPTKPGAKRPAETDKNGKVSGKKMRKISNGDETEEKKSGIQRLWSTEDEIVMLKGMIDYQSKKGTDPFADMVAFHEFIKKSLRADVSKSQLMAKIRRVKKKYQGNAKRGENGEDPVFSRPHEHMSFELSKKIWGGGANNALDDNVKTNNRSARRSGKVNNALASPKQEVAAALKAEVKADQNEFWSHYPCLNESLQSGKFYNLSLPDSAKSFVKERLGLIGSAKAKELEGKWRNLQVAELELYLKRLVMIKEQTTLILDAIKSSSKS